MKKIPYDEDDWIIFPKNLNKYDNDNDDEEELEEE